MVSKKRRYDLREFWPWYERSVSLPPGVEHTTPPPFTLADIARKERPAKRGSRPILSVLWLAAGVVLVAFLLWVILR